MQLTATDLSCERGGRTVFADVNFTVARRRACWRSRGPNGAGKSTLLRLIAGLSEPAEGQLTLQGGIAEISPSASRPTMSPTRMRSSRRLSVAENLDFWGDFLGGGERRAGACDPSISKNWRTIPPRLFRPARSAAWRCRGLLSSFRTIWLLDEPTVGLDTDSQERLLGLTRGHLSEGGLILVATHVPLGIRRRCVSEPRGGEVSVILALVRRDLTLALRQGRRRRHGARLLSDRYGAAADRPRTRPGALAAHRARRLVDFAAACGAAVGRSHLPGRL